MLETEHLKLFLEDQSNIIVDLNISIKNINRLIADKYEYEDEVKQHGFFVHHIYQLKFILVIQLSKLFSKRKGEERSFYKLCNKLESSEYGTSLKILLENNKNKTTEEVRSKADVINLVNDVRKLLLSQDELSERIVRLRDQIYAHIDINPSVQNVSLNEIEKLVEIASEIHNLVRFRIFFWKTRFDHLRDWDIDYVLCYMANHRKNKLENINKKKDGLL
ncbi:hypothetical protein [Spirosoma sp.]|uniref:AbiU2 domain-containing protein n=1 Tax=Spirosoma sp. TaxID=1899569 RepID=UPI003B3B9CE6